MHGVAGGSWGGWSARGRAARALEHGGVERRRVGRRGLHGLPVGLKLLCAEGRLEGMLVEHPPAELQLLDLLLVEALLHALGDQPVDVHRPALPVAVRAVHGLRAGAGASGAVGCG